MATSIANISWVPVPGSVSTLVEYKVSGTTTWITPVTPTNPTSYSVYSLLINNGVRYDVRLTTNGLRCAPGSKTFQIINSMGACCPAGYALSLDGSYCYQTNTTLATPPTSSDITAASPYFNYGAYGSVIYNPGYSIDGYGSFTLINVTNPFWINNPENTTNGPNNRTALWASTGPGVNQDIGFTKCVTLPNDGVYYVGCFADNYIRINVDGTPIVVMNPLTMASYFEANGYPGIGPSVTFYFWHIYPITLTTGNHVIEVIGHNDSGPAGMGAEIYNATSAQIRAATSYGSFGSQLIFSSKDYFGQPVQIGTGGLGYTCPSGYSLVLCDGPAYCTQTLTTPIITC